MQTHDFLLILLGILLTARIFAELAIRLKMPSVIGELVAGIVLGPSLLGWIEPVEAIKLLAEVGILLLLFEVGLETDIRRLVNAGSRSVIVAVSGFVLPFAFGFSLAHWLFDLSILISLFIGGTLTATSIGITVRVLTDMGRQQSREGQIVLGAAVLDDVFGVILLAILYEFSTGGGVSLMNVGKVFIFVGSFFVLAPIAAKLISLIIRHFDSVSEISGLIPTMIVSLVLFFAWLAHVVGAPELLGGFAAGLALSRRFFLPLGVALRADESFSHRIEEQMKPIVHLFTPIFFVMVGLSLNLHKIDWSSAFIWQFSLSMLLFAFIGKMVGAFFIREPLSVRLMTGVAMVPRGEVGLIFAELGRVSGIYNNEIYAGMILVIAFTTLIPPFLMKWLHRHYPTSVT
ncbi:MAG: cation:proton antiporter [Gammaproteobacteria bacterium]|nr:cation:proton antiporter [Gammaproteobacteria bacterium]